MPGRDRKSRAAPRQVPRGRAGYGFAAVRDSLAVLREGGGTLARLPSALARLRHRR